MLTEVWLPVDGFPGYEVGGLGHVRSPRGVLTPWASNPRPTVGLYRGGKRCPRKIHKLIAGAFLGPCPPGKEVCHQDGDFLNNAWTNLRYGTKSSNAYDRVRHGKDSHRNRTVCPLGHRLVVPNLTEWGAGRKARVCLSCARARPAVHKAAKRGVIKDMQVEADRRYAVLMEGC